MSLSFYATGIDEFTMLLSKAPEVNKCQSSVAELFSVPLSFETPPISKGAIFKSANLSLVEKRSLMKFITTFVLEDRIAEGGSRALKKDPIAKKTPAEESTHCSHSRNTKSDNDSSVKEVMPAASKMSSFLSAASIYAKGYTNAPRADEMSDTLRLKQAKEELLTKPQSWASALNGYRLSSNLRQRITYGLCLKNHLESSDYCSDLMGKEKKEITQLFDWPKDTGLERLYLIASSFGKYCEGAKFLCGAIM